MQSSKKSLIALLLISFIPTFSIAFSLIISNNELISQIVFVLCKIWIFSVPTYWYFKVDKSKLEFFKPSNSGIYVGTISGLVLTSIILATWYFLGDSIDKVKMLNELNNTGLTDVRLFIAATFYWIFINSLLEEYVFRWFITMRSIDLTGSENIGILVSAFLFTLHHSLALHLLGFVWWQTVMASLGLITAAAVWSWLYVRYKSIIVCWISHAICDIAVFGIAYQIIFT